MAWTGGFLTSRRQQSSRGFAPGQGCGGGWRSSFYLKLKCDYNQDMPTKSTRIKKWHPKFLAALAKSGIIGDACKAAGINRGTFYDHRDKDPEFAKAAADAIEASIETLEKEARRRALQGTNKPVFHQGRECGKIKEYSDTLTIFLLKAQRPEIYRERYDLRHSGKIETGAADKLTDDQLAAIIHQPEGSGEGTPSPPPSA